MVIKKKCIICNKLFKKPQFISNKIFKKRKYCTKECYNIGMTGKRHWNYGKKTPKKIKDKISETLSSKGSNAPRGDKHHNWRGGITAVNRRTIKSQEKLAGRKKPKQCDICGREKKIVFDHDHKTNKFRGWLCYRCNLLLGMVDDNINTLNDLIKYLKNS